MLNAALPGTLVVAAATVLLILVTVSTPIDKTFYFLSANISATVESVSIKGTITAGVFGYCLTLTNDPAQLLGFTDSRIEQAINLNGVSSSVIKSLSYVLVLHPIAAGFAGVAFISGIIQHFREFAGSGITAWLTSFATTLAMLAFIFDIIVFSIAKSRIDDASSSVSTSASLGNAVWLTLAAAILLLLSGCFFCCGRRFIGRKRRGQFESDRLRPTGDDAYADRMRRDAEYAEKRRFEDSARKNDSGSLPAFAEFGNEEQRHEAIPLKDMDGDDDEHERYSDGDHHVLLSSAGGQYPPQNNRGPGAENVSGVGMGYGRRSNPATSPTSPTGARPPFVGAAAAGMAPRRTGSTDTYGNRLPSHVEPASSYMSPPPMQAMDLPASSPYGPHSYEDPYAAATPAHGGVGGFVAPQSSYPTYGSDRPLPMPGAAPSSAYHDAYETQDIASPVSPSGGGGGGGYRSQPYDPAAVHRPASPQSYAPTYQTMAASHGHGGQGSQGQTAQGQGAPGMEQQFSGATTTAGWPYGYRGPPSYREF